MKHGGAVVPHGMRAVAAYVDRDLDGRLSLQTEEAATCFWEREGWQCDIERNRAVIRIATNALGGSSIVEVHLAGSEWDVELCEPGDDGVCVEEASVSASGMRVYRSCGTVGLIRFKSRDRVFETLLDTDRVDASPVRVHALPGRVAVEIGELAENTRLRAWSGPLEVIEKPLSVVRSSSTSVDVDLPGPPRACTTSESCNAWIQVARLERLHREYGLIVDRSIETFAPLASVP